MIMATRTNISQFEEDEGGEKDEGVLEETEEEVTIIERPGVPEAPPSMPKPKPRRPSAAKAKRKPARAKARPKKKAAAKKSSEEEFRPQELKISQEALNLGPQPLRLTQGENHFAHEFNSTSESPQARGDANCRLCNAAGREAGRVQSCRHACTIERENLTTGEEYPLPRKVDAR